MNMIEDIFGTPIYAYTRRQAIKDGILVDVSKMAKEAGFKCPVAITTSVWHKYCEWSDVDTRRQTYQDIEGRLWDVLNMLRFACKENGDSHCIHYSLYVVPRGGRARRAKLTTLKAMIGTGNNGKMVITIMLPNED